MGRFNHHMMTLARDSKGLTQADLADALGVGQGTVSKYETGLSEPPEAFLEDISEALSYPVDFFYEPGRPYGLPPFHFRRRKKLSAKALSRIVAEINIRRLHIVKLLQSFDYGGNGFIPEIDRDEYIGKSNGVMSIENVARQIREMWMLPSGPIEDLVGLIEDCGGIVVPCDFGTDLIDAVSQRIDGLPVLFFVNINIPADRMRYSLAHELGHMILHTILVKDDGEMEDEADAFAGEFLLPAGEIRPQLRKFDLRQLANLKTYWKVSMQSLAVRANRLNLITPYQYKQFWMEMGRLGYRRREPNELPKERPSKLRQMISHHTEKLNYSIEEMAQLLLISSADFRSMYRTEILEGGSTPQPPGKPHLRLVK